MFGSFFENTYITPLWNKKHLSRTVIKSTILFLFGFIIYLHSQTQMTLLIVNILQLFEEYVVREVKPSYFLVDHDKHTATLEFLPSHFI